MLNAGEENILGYYFESLELKLSRSIMKSIEYFYLILN